MATIDYTKSYPSGFNFSGDPVPVCASGSFPSGSVLRRLVFTAHVYFQSLTLNYPFEVAVEGNEQVIVDVSSALRAAMSRWRFDPGLIEKREDGTYHIDYPKAVFEVSVGEKYMLDGDMYEAAAVLTTRGRAYYGKLTHYDRYLTDAHPNAYIGTVRLSRFPGEKRYGNGDWMDESYVGGTDDTAYTTFEVNSRGGDYRDGKYMHFLFVNTLGVFETISAPMRESLSYNITSEKFVLAGERGYASTADRVADKSSPRASFAMSSGYVSVREGDWWATEFLAAKQCWVRMKRKARDASGSVASQSVWVPVAVTPADDATTIYDKADGEPVHVDFDAEVALSGSLFTMPGAE